MYIEFKPADIEDVLEYWQDISQDPEFISHETGLDIKYVLDILKYLQDDNSIEDFNEIVKSKLETTIKENNNLYKKDINEIYDAYIFKVIVKNIEYEDTFLVINLTVSFMKKDYEISILYENNEDIYLKSDKGIQYINKMKEDMQKDNIELLNTIIKEIIDDHIQENFWENYNN